MQPSRREAILDALKARLEAISTASGFNTNAGASVHLGEAPPFGPDDPQAAIVMVVEDDEVVFQGLGLQITLPISLQAVVASSATVVELGLAYRTAEAILGDIKTAVELSDRTLGGMVGGTGLERGVTQTLKREPGSEFVGVAIQYRARYHESWGNP